MCESAGACLLGKGEGVVRRKREREGGGERERKRIEWKS